MIAASNQNQFLFLRKLEHAREEIFYPDLVVLLKIPALRDKETARLIATVQEPLSVETTTANSSDLSSTRKMIAV